MVVERLPIELMPFLIYGDQIHEVNGNQISTKKHLDLQFQNAASIPSAVTLTIIRVWNIRPATKSQILNQSVIDERCAYFVVRVQKFMKVNGCKMKYERKKITIVEVAPRSNASFAFLQGDRILDFDGSHEVSAQLAKYDITCVRRVYAKRMKRDGYIDCFMERPIGVRSSPNPSVYGELSLVLPLPPKTSAIAGISQNEKTVMVPSATSFNSPDPPIESDAVEIALRELCRVQAQIADDSFSLFHKGRSLLRDKDKNIERSVFMIDVNRANPDRKKTKRRTLRKPRPNQIIAFKDTPETSRILSDVSDDVELKKVDARSGIVAYIRNAFG
ncbi:unnamed protein product [Caenorhabditis bovis]|uniref:PDZ domain-containing protein n=1 Tax=Caenorhabditis bovis TaxID=2654633 RepID=A0A8S1F2N7_9PELO|nr:unnamed protein product [Caenorhabditis bovis]